ncbi:MAG: hypothetical protein U0797_00025 [Gemmataceae bacterium]
MRPLRRTVGATLCVICLAAAGAGAQGEVGSGGPRPPTMIPDLIGRTTASARAAARGQHQPLHVVGARPRCEHQRRVVSQRPPAGAFRPTGTGVWVRLGC